MDRPQPSPHQLIFSTADIARLLSVDPRTVISWTAQGKLRAFRTPGGHRRIKKSDFFLFLRNHNIPLPSGWRNGEKSVVLVGLSPRKRVRLRRFLEETFPTLTVMETNEAAAAEDLARFRPDAVVLNRLPERRETHFCAELRRNPSLAHVRVAALSDGAGRAPYDPSVVDALLPFPFTPWEARRIFGWLLDIPEEAKTPVAP